MPPHQIRPSSPRFARLIAVSGLLACLLLSAPSRAADSRAADSFTPAQRSEIVRILREALVKDPSILRDAVEALQVSEKQTEAETARAMLAANQASLIDPADPVAGNPDGNVTIVEFFDTRCGYCKRLEAPMAELLKGDQQIRLVYKDLPVLGPASVLGAKALIAAQRQGRYEALRNALMHTDIPHTKDTIRAEAVRLGLDWPRLSQDMDAPETEARIQKNLRLAAALGIQGTPAMVIGDTLIPGAVDLAELQRAVAGARKK